MILKLIREINRKRFELKFVQMLFGISV